MERVVCDDFMALFDTFERTAFRLETRDHYKVEEEAKAWNDFLASERLDLAWFQPWLDTLARIAATSRTMSRVRLLSDPPTDYQRFELAVASANIQAGETILLLERSKAQSLDLPDYDFWLFDDERLVTMLFDDDGAMVEAVVTDDQDAVRRHREVQTRAIVQATSYDDYIAAHRLRPASEA